MKHTEARELLFVDRYLAGTLSAVERKAFEAHILECEECLDELALTERLRQGFKDAFGDESVSTAMPAPAGSMSLSNAPRYATAASVLLAASLLAAGLMHGRQDGNQGIAAAQVFPIQTTRSIDADATSVLRLASPDAMAVLLVDTYLTDYPDYRVHVMRADADSQTTVTELDGLLPTYEDMVAVTIPAAALPAGNYAIELSGRAGQEDAYERVTSLRFRVIE